MTRQEMEAEVARLLQRAAELNRLNLQLPPDQRLLLDRLLYQLGWKTSIQMSSHNKHTVRRMALHGTTVPSDGEAKPEPRPSRPDEDLRVYRQQMRPNFTGQWRKVIGTHAELPYIHDFLVRRGLKVKPSNYTYYDDTNHILYHHKPEDKASVARYYLGLSNIRLSKKTASLTLGTPKRALNSGKRINRHVVTDHKGKKIGTLDLKIRRDGRKVVMFLTGASKKKRVTQKVIRYNTVEPTPLRETTTYTKANRPIRGFPTGRNFVSVYRAWYNPLNQKHEWRYQATVPHMHDRHGPYERLPEGSKYESLGEDKNYHGRELNAHELWAYNMPGGEAPTQEGPDYRPGDTLPEDFYAMKRKPKRYALIRLSPKQIQPGSGYPLVFHDIHDANTGDKIGSVHVIDAGPMLHMEWVQGNLGYSGARMLHDELAKMYPRAQYITSGTGKRVSGFRVKQDPNAIGPRVPERVVIPVRRRMHKVVKKYALTNRLDFVGALQKASSPNHKQLIQSAKKIASQLGVQETKEFPALHDTPHGAVPGVATAIYGPVNPKAVHSLGSWVNGLLPNNPGYAVFHTRPIGPDTLYRFRMDGSGMDTRVKLDRFGLRSRVFVPHRRGMDVLIPDKGSTLRDRVEQFVQHHGVQLESSQGFLETTGSSDQAQARNQFRGRITAQEHQQLSRKKPKRYVGVRWTEEGGEEDPSPPHPITPKRVGNPKWKKPESERKVGPDAPSQPSFKGHDLPEEKDDTEYIQRPYVLPRHELPGNRPHELAPEKEDKIPPRLSSKPTGREHEEEYHEGLQPPTERKPPSYWTYKPPEQIHDVGTGIKQPPTGYRPPDSKNLFKDSEFNKLHQWAYNHSLTHRNAFARFMGISPEEAQHFLHRAIILAAHEMRRSGKNSITSHIGRTGKRIKINIARKNWNDVTGTKTVKPGEHGTGMWGRPVGKINESRATRLRLRRLTCQSPTRLNRQSTSRLSTNYKFSRLLFEVSL